MTHMLLRDLRAEDGDLISPDRHVVVRIIGGRTRAENKVLAREVLKAINTQIQLENGHLAGVREAE